MKAVLAIGLVVLAVLLLLTTLKLIPARYTIIVEGSGGAYTISLGMTDAKNEEFKTFKGTVPDQITFWTNKPWVELSYGSEKESTLTLKRWGKVCALSSSPGNFVMGKSAECFPTQSLH